MREPREPGPQDASADRDPHRVGLNPGSDAAQERGCTCAVLDNAHGTYPHMGFDPETGEPLWLISEGCPLHSWAWGSDA